MRRSGAPSQRFLPPGTSSVGASAIRRPLVSVQQAVGVTGATSGSGAGALNESHLGRDDGETRYFSVVYCKSSARKHKKYEDDAMLIVRAKTRLAILKDAAGKKEIARGSGLQMSKLEELASGGQISFGGKDVEVMEELTRAKFESAAAQVAEAEPGPDGEGAETANPPLSAPRNQVVSKTVFKPFSAPARFGMAPNMNSSSRGNLNARPMFNANHPDALVLPRPPFHAMRSGAGAPGESATAVLTDVVVDPHLSRQLRPHQATGVVFLYRCVMGFNEEGNKGVILADEMGLGKTLQTITLIWTLLKQGPWGGRPVAKRVLILAPSSLVKNWQAEFGKWLGSERINVFAVDQSNRVTEYLSRQNVPVLIMSYEMFVRSYEHVTRLRFDLLVCDEGHRLKNEKIKASTLLGEMDTEMRVVLTGTPLQNDLKEFYAIACVVNPNVLGSPASFARKYEDPIVRSKQPEATEDEIEDGRAREEELNELTSAFILRRTQDVISKFLPPKTEMVLFCRPTQLQSYIYEQTLNGIGSVFALDNSCVLENILHLRKICNHPSLVNDSQGDKSTIPEELLDCTLEEQGSKLAVVSYLLHNLRTAGSEKIVLVSISTQVLDLLGELCQHYEYPFLRLDGSTSANQRQGIVNRFNASYGNDFVLLLSSKAGGTGLNLIGASRILLYDMDWNPAHDIQAMARVWRDGQKKPVRVYRLVTSGTIEEKIFQRQITKQTLGGGVVEGKKGNSAQFHFTTSELRDLFTFRPTAACDTHELLGCECDGSNGSNVGNASDESAAEVRACQLGEGRQDGSNFKTDLVDLKRWQHLLPPVGQIPDDALAEATEYITFAFVNVHK